MPGRPAGIADTPVVAGIGPSVVHAERAMTAMDLMTTITPRSVGSRNGRLQIFAVTDVQVIGRRRPVRVLPRHEHAVAADIAVACMTAVVLRDQEGRAGL